MLIIAVLTSWLPTLFREVGYSLGGSAKIASTFQIGGTVGAIVLGWMMDRFNPYRVLAGVYFVGVIAIAAVAALYREYALLILSVGAIGFCVSGGQVGANALAAAFYPTASRATGVSWALGVGRIGSIFGSLAGGSLLGMGLHFSQIFNLMTIPALIASTMVLIMSFTYTKKRVIAPLALS
jgi:AAHS family 4-hydroxybenzoate transporter-like MFS transporter